MNKQLCLAKLYESHYVCMVYTVVVDANVDAVWRRLC